MGDMTLAPHPRMAPHTREMIAPMDASRIVRQSVVVDDVARRVPVMTMTGMTAIIGAAGMISARIAAARHEADHVPARSHQNTTSLASMATTTPPTPPQRLIRAMTR